MLDEIVSGILGGAIAQRLSKRFPPRNSKELSSIPAQELEVRNKYLYIAMLFACIVGFFSPFLLVAFTNKKSAWVAGAMFGLPFLFLLLIALSVGMLSGFKRMRELIFYFEQQQNINIYVIYMLGAPLAALGLASIIFIW